MKSGNVSIVYAIVTFISLLLVVFYLYFEKKKSFRFFALYAFVAIANCGYLLLAVSDTLPGALWANRISYFGCAYAVMTMVFIVAEVCGIRFNRVCRVLIVCGATAAFGLAATGGWLDIYYSSVSLEVVNGVTTLCKEYADAHILYPIYIGLYFILMTAMIIRSVRKDGPVSTRYAAFLTAVVLGNIGVWGVEQIIDVDFEFLSISFVATELLLVLLSSVIREQERLMERARSTDEAMNSVAAGELPPDIEELFRSFARRVATLTPTERMVLQYFIEGCTLEEVAEKAFISINTAKKHNSNLNRKLELRSREELILYIDLFRRAGRLSEISYQQQN